MKKLLAVVLTTGLVGHAFAQTSPVEAPAPQTDGAAAAAAATGSLTPDVIGATIIGVSAVAVAIGSGNGGSNHGNANTPGGVGGGTTGTTGTTGTH